MRTIRFTFKQIEILEAIKKGRSDGLDCDVYDVLDAVSYDVKRDALLHSMKILIDNGYVVRTGRLKRGPRNTMGFRVTTKATEVI